MNTVQIVDPLPLAWHQTLHKNAPAVNLHLLLFLFTMRRVRVNLFGRVKFIVIILCRAS
jgi:hypothetical protein